MSNSDIVSRADKALRPVLKELGRFPWIRLEGCCAGHKPEDSLWLEINILGSSGLRRLMELLKILDGKLTGTDCRLDCLLSYAAGVESSPAPHGWIPTAVEGLNATLTLESVPVTLPLASIYARVDFVA